MTFMNKAVVPKLYLVGLFAALFCFSLRVCAVEADAAVRGLIERIAPGHAGDFAIESIPAPEGENVFEVEARAGKIVLRGDGPLSRAVAFNWYLKHDVFVDVSWYVDDSVNLPAKLPLPKEKIRLTTKIKNRFFLNYCTFGYTMPFWRWRDWETSGSSPTHKTVARPGNEICPDGWRTLRRAAGGGTIFR